MVTNLYDYFESCKIFLAASQSLWFHEISMLKKKIEFGGVTFSLGFCFRFGCVSVIGRMSVSVNPSDQVCENGTEHVELLPATNDAHGGVIVEMREAMDPRAFLTLLRASISQWRQEVLLSYTFTCFHQCILV